MFSSQNRHGSSDTSGEIIIPPVAHHSLGVCVELNSVSSIKVGSANERILGTSEAEERRRNRDRKIDSNLSNVGVELNPSKIST